MRSKSTNCLRLEQTRSRCFRLWRKLLPLSEETGSVFPGGLPSTTRPVYAVSHYTRAISSADQSSATNSSKCQRHAGRGGKSVFQSVVCLLPRYIYMLSILISCIIVFRAADPEEGKQTRQVRVLLPPSFLMAASRQAGFMLLGSMYALFLLLGLYTSAFLLLHIGPDLSHSLEINFFLSPLFATPSLALFNPFFSSPSFFLMTHL